MDLAVPMAPRWQAPCVVMGTACSGRRTHAVSLYMQAEAALPSQRAWGWKAASYPGLARSVSATREPLLTESGALLLQ
jgi:hypothetical protein